MKLVVEEEKETTCNGNGITNESVTKKVVPDPVKVTTNGDVHTDGSKGSNESLNGTGDLLVEDTNGIRNGIEDNQNGSKADDTRSWSSNSSNIPAPDIDEDLSDEMTLRLSDEEEDLRTTEINENEKDSIQFTAFASSPLPTADPKTIANKNPFSTLIEEDNLNSKIDDTDINNQQNKTLNKSSDSNELNNLTSEISPEKTKIPTDDQNMSVTELREEIQGYLKTNDADNIPNDKIDKSSEIKEESSNAKDSDAAATSKLDNDNNCLKINDDSSKEDNSDAISDKSKIEETSSEIINSELNDKDNLNSVKTAEIIENSDKKEDITNKETSNDETDKDISEETTNKETSEINKEAINSPDTNKDTENVSEQNEEIPETDKNLTQKEETGKISDIDISTPENIEKTKDINISTPENIEKTKDINISTPENIEKTEDVQQINEDKIDTSDVNKEEISNKNEEPMEIDSNTNNTSELESNEKVEIKNEEINKENASEAMEVDATNLNEIKDIPIIEENKTIPEDLNKEIVDKKLEKEEIKIEDLKGVKEKPDSGKSLKRSLETENEENDSKKPKINVKTDLKPKEKKEYVQSDILREFMSKKEISKITRAELEELCTQKMCECINQTSKVGELNRLIKQQEQVIESFRNKYNALKKQISDLSIVQNKMLQEVRSAKAKDGNNSNLMPVKITRSVGLQVTLSAVRNIRGTPQSPEALPAAPMQKRKVQRISMPSKLPSAQTPITPITPAKPVSATIPKQPNIAPTSAKGIKTILPRVNNIPDGNKDPSTPNSLLGNYLQSPTPIKTVQNNVARKNVTVVNSSTSPANTTTASANKVIDLTDEDDITKTTPIIPTNIRVVAPHQINNANSNVVTSQMQRVTYLVSPGVGQQGQVLLATTSAPTRPGVPRPTIMLKPVQAGQVPSGQRLNLVRPTIPGSTVTVLPANNNATIRPGQQIRFQTAGTTTVSATRTQMMSARSSSVNRHPAPLPGPPAVQPSQPTWKAMPPKPSLKISRVGDGIVLSWKMLNKDMSLYEDIASYQLYAYQETNAQPSTDMWRKVGDVKALALPMACTLTQFTDGNKYHFAVRAVDVKSRVGPFSQPEQIALV